MVSRVSDNSAMQETVWVIGGGQFGRRAVDMLTKATPDCSIVVVDPNPEIHLSGDIDIVCADGVGWLVEQLARDAVVAKIVPALPLHLLGAWVKIKLKEHGLNVDTPELMLELFPDDLHPIQLHPGQVVLSYANFPCPENCSEPDALCTYTKLPRPTAMYRRLKTMDCANFTPLIARSRQFAPGVGGFFPDDLWNILADIKNRPGVPLMVGTACKCHGIVDTVCWS